MGSRATQCAPVAFATALSDTVATMRTVFAAGLLLALSCKREAAPAHERLDKIDVHEHLSPGSLGHVLPMLEAQGIRTVVNLSGGSSGRGLEQQLEAAKQHEGRVIVFCTPDFTR